MAKKIITLQEAIQVAYYVAEKIEGKGKSLAGVYASHENAGYPWREQCFRVSLRGKFDIYSTRLKHKDGRIRDSYYDVEGVLNFAFFCIEHFPDIHPLVAEWRKRLLDPSSIAFTLPSPAAKKWVRQQMKDYGPPADEEKAIRLTVSDRAIGLSGQTSAIPV